MRRTEGGRRGQHGLEQESGAVRVVCGDGGEGVASNPNMRGESPACPRLCIHRARMAPYICTSGVEIQQWKQPSKLASLEAYLDACHLITHVILLAYG